MSVIDVAMVGRLGTEALAATGMGSMMFGRLSLAIGIRTAVQTVTARRLGRVCKESGIALRNGLALATLYSLQSHFLFGDTLIHSLDSLLKTIATPLTTDYVSIVFLAYCSLHTVLFSRVFLRN